MESIEFRRASLADVPALITVQNAAFAEDFARYGECPSYGEDPALMAGMIADAFVYLIVAGEEVVGDFILRHRPDGSWYVRTVSVVPAWQGRGIGSAAMRFMEREFGAGVWRLCTPQGTARNRRFYENLGYRQVGEHVVNDQLTLIDFEKVVG